MYTYYQLVQINSENEMSVEQQLKAAVCLLQERLKKQEDCSIVKSAINLISNEKTI